MHPLYVLSSYSPQRAAASSHPVDAFSILVSDSEIPHVSTDYWFLTYRRQKEAKTFNLLV